MIDAATSANRFEAASNTKQQLEKWSLIEDIIYNQKSIVQWLKLGDANTTYFYASMKGRKTQNQIRTLSTKGGTILKSEDSIEAEIVGLIAPFTREDVAQALKGVDDSKALGGDGFNSCFFKKSGHVLGDEVTDAVLQFFDTGAIWIMSCINIVTYSIIINGSPTLPFAAKRGIRQGDLMSLFLLFVLAMKYLTRLLRTLKSKSDFNYHPSYFQQFSSASGLIANQSKSCIYFGGVPEGVQQDIMRLLDLAGELYHSDILGYQ
ncbi:uncharacterized protein LOC107804176 [Nicotiana tabacum]|uniref:Uncharacterized protein LOC107804176 n=1 Tax=Nicotiana tabacum TaxID=4097 RepID=A0AC58U2M1_TOBAC